MIGRKRRRKKKISEICVIDRFVLTAAHCVDEDTSDVGVVLGKHLYIDHQHLVSYVR